MGSGCTGNINNCTQEFSSNCVLWAGNPITGLGVCTGDTLTEVIESIYTLVGTIENGSAITLPTITFGCDILSNEMAGKENNLENILQSYSTVICELNELITDLTDTVNTPVSYNVDCLTVEGDDTPSVLQATINKVCSLSEQLTTITNDIGTTSITNTINTYTGNKILSALTSCGNYGLKKTGSGDTAAIQFYGFLPPNCPTPCVADLSNFDSDGKGKEGTAYCGWYICNGKNGTPNMLGYTFASATNLPGVLSTSLDSRVDPAYDSTRATSVGDKKGEVKHQLTSSEMPSHSHSATADPHNHVIPQLVPDLYVNGGGQFSIFSNGNQQSNQVGTTNANINITVTSTGGSQSHENRQPTYYGYFIMRIN